MESRSATLRKEWEAANNKPWPKDRATGQNQHVHHKKAKADGGSDTLRNIEPKPKKQHIEHHKKKGDFKRWGKRSNNQKHQDKKDEKKEQN
jgi:hypothetical protein